MTEGAYWYVLEFNEGAYITVGGGAVSANSFESALSSRDGQSEFSLRLWRALDDPNSMADDEFKRAREECVLAAGAADELAVELRMNGICYQVGRRAGGTPARTIRVNLGHQVEVRADETHDARDAGQIFWSFFRTGGVDSGSYPLREKEPLDILKSEGAKHALTIDFHEHRAVLPGVAADEFSAFLNDVDKNDPSVLVLWPLLQGKPLAELSAEELSDQQEFLQAAGSRGRYTVEVRKRVGDTFKLYTVGSKVDHLVWGTELTEVAVGSQTIRLYPNEVFGTAEVGALFQHYVRMNKLPGEKYLLGEIQ